MSFRACVCLPSLPVPRACSQVHIIDDDSIISSVLDTCSSTRVRKALIQRQPVVEMVGTAVDRCVGAVAAAVWQPWAWLRHDITGVAGHAWRRRYLHKHGCSDKLAGKEKWSARDKQPVASHYGHTSGGSGASTGRSRGNRSGRSSRRSHTGSRHRAGSGSGGGGGRSSRTSTASRASSRHDVDADAASESGSSGSRSRRARSEPRSSRFRQQRG